MMAVLGKYCMLARDRFSYGKQVMFLLKPEMNPWNARLIGPVYRFVIFLDGILGGKIYMVNPGPMGLHRSGINRL